MFAVFDARHPTPEATASVSTPAADSRPPGYFWTTPEVTLMRELYPTAGGPARCREALPHRTQSAISRQARLLGLRAPPGNTTGKRFARLYEPSERIDAIIREGYAHAKKRGDLKVLAETTGRPDWWVQKRATQLGVSRTCRTRVDAWTDRELAILETWAACDLPAIGRKLRAGGFDRTPTAIAVQLKRLKFDRTDPDRWTAPELAGLLGVSAATVADWIRRRRLKAQKRACRPNGVYVLRRQDVRAWIVDHQCFIDLRKVDQVWFMDLAFGSRR